MSATPAPVLRDFLADPARPEHTLTYHELQGFLFAVACSPELVMPSEWMPVIFDDQPAAYASEAEAQHVLGQLTTLYNEVNATVGEEQPQLPADCTIATGAMDNFDADAPLALWSRGFVLGHQWLGELWEVELPEGADDELGAALMTLTFFASRSMAEELAQEDPTGEHTVLTLAPRIVEMWPEAMACYAFFGRTVLGEAYAAAAREPRRAAKVGRNDPCPCGSGKKFKLCCGK